MNKVVISKEVDPYYNLALEEALLYSVQNDEVILYLWQNEKTVVIGRNQNPWLECDLDYLEQEKIHLARRVSGGGAVFHDLGNLNFTFITRKEHCNLEKQLSVIVKGIEKLNINVMFSGRNDLLAKDRKFSGHAFYEDEDYYFHHGTIMFDVDFDYLSKVLKPSKLKLQSKGISSVRSRIINLKEINKEMTLEQLKKSLIESFGEVYGEIEKEEILKSEKYMPNGYEKYRHKEWIYKESPSFDAYIEEKLNKGLIQVALKVKNGRIENVEVYSDSLEKVPLEMLKEQLLHSDMNEKRIREYIKRIDVLV